ncbi:MAG: hypothetical protein GTO02_22080, partial [Candidatus Dadabacteria bacterium]|nr:hypothetical protein [Candidatus Dadabacteria bacterium]NIQ16972.1 hypothetical protein [Candidatus Dadabacteria bacterium]
MLIRRVLLSAFLLFFCFSINSYSQTTTPQVPEVQPQPQFPSFIVKPSEDLNPYGLSTIGGSTEKDYNTGKSTLGTTEQRRSNAEINREIEERKKKEQERKTTTTEGAAETSDVEIQEIDISEEELVEDTPQVSTKSTKLIYWKDDKGNIHITNDIGT